MAVKKFSLEAVIDLTDKMTKPMQNIEKNMTGFSKKMQKNFGGVGNDIKSLDKGINKAAMGLGVVAVAGTAAAFALGKSFIDAGAQVEKYKTILTTMLGSQEEANARFEEYSKLAAVTPFELNDVVELGNALQALGRYSKDNLIMLGDLAAASGKPIDQVKNAFAKLVSGQKGEAVNMFRDLLISNDDWVKATGKGVKKTGELMATTEEMIAALPAILSKKGFTGMMDNMSKSYDGLSSNFADTVTRFKQNIGTMLLPAGKNLMSAMTQKMQEFSDVTTDKGKKAVEAITRLIDQLATAIMNFDLAKFIENVGKAITKIKDTLKSMWAVLNPVVGIIIATIPIILAVAGALTPIAPIIMGLIIAVKLITAAMTIYNAVMWLVSLNPVTLTIIAIVAAIAVLAVGITALVKNWDSVVAVMKVVGGFFVNIGQTIMKWLLLPINLVMDAIGGLLGLLSKLPGIGEKLKPAVDALNSVQAGMNRTLTGTEGATDFAGVWGGGYSNPDTRVSESRTSSTTTNRSVVDINAPAGFGMSERGSNAAPKMTLSYGRAQ